MKMLTMPLGMIAANCYFIWDEQTRHAAVIDPGEDPDTVLSVLKQNELSLSVILLTHGHFDHYWGAPAVQRATSAPIYIHEADADRLADHGPAYPGRPPRSLYKPPQDVHTVRSGDSIVVGSLTFMFVHTPGHSPGSCFIRCGGSYFTGDTLFAGDIGRVDLPGGDPDAMRRTLKEVAAMTDDGPVYPGHDRASTLSYEQAHNSYLLTGNL